jgi:hypothetical protein
MNKIECPKCGLPTLRAGAVKCPACKTWVGPRPGRPLRALTVALTVAGLSGAGMAISAAAILVASILWAPGGSRPWSRWIRPSVAPADVQDASFRSPPPESAGSASAPTESGSAPPGPPAASQGSHPEAPGAAGSFSEPRLVRASVAPLDAVISDDDLSLFVLGDDGSVRMHELGSGKEVRKLLVPGRGSEIRLLAGKYLAVLGVPGAMPLIDLTTYVVGRIDIGGPAVDIVALSHPPALVVATGISRKVVRLSSSGGLRPEGQIVLPKPVSGLVRTQVGEREMLAVLTQSKPDGGLGSVDIFDPAASPFGASRSSWIVAVDPRRGAVSKASIFVVDRSAGQLLEVYQDQERPPRVVNVGQSPLSAHRLVDGWIVTVDGAGTATVLTEDTLELTATIPLGAVPSDAAVTPDGRALLVALGGGPWERGATTSIIAGDPPRVVGKLSTGPGSHRVRISKSGRFAAVAASLGRSVAILERR